MQKYNIIDFKKQDLNIISKIYLYIRDIIKKDFNRYFLFIKGHNSRSHLIINKDYIYLINMYFSIRIINNFSILIFSDYYQIELENNFFFRKIDNLYFDSMIDLNQVYIDNFLINCKLKKDVIKLINNRFTVNNKQNNKNIYPYKNQFKFNKNMIELIKEAFNKIDNNKKVDFYYCKINNELDFICNNVFEYDLKLNSFLETLKN